MKKLMLEPGAVRVESFQPAAGGSEPGTVRGHWSAYDGLCQPDC